MSQSQIVDQPAEPQGRDTEHRHPRDSKNKKYSNQLSLPQQDDFKKKKGHLELRTV